MSAPLIQALLQAGAYDHTCQEIQLIETHISWVILTGSYAYKIKKPVDFGFLDYSTLEKRRSCCEKELELNRRLAPELYIEVVEIRGEPDTARIDGNGEVLEYAIRMRQFPAGRLLADLADRGELDAGIIDQLAETISDFHGHTPCVAETSTFGTPAAVRQPVMENFQQIAALSVDRLVQQRIQELADWSDAQLLAKESSLLLRKQQGYVRECHGDLHLGNLVALDHRILPFDCIEFNDNLRCIDVISELSFLFMDIDDHGHRDLAWRLLNRYLEYTGDYAGITMLQFYLVYRAMVRAKVALLRCRQQDIDNDEKIAAETAFENYLSLAEHYAGGQRPLLVIMHGLSGSGKTYVSQRLLQNIGMLRVRSDVERKRLAGLTPSDDSRSGISAGIYNATRSRQTYTRLADVAETACRAGLPIIVDAAFLKQEQRRAFLQLAKRLRVRPLIVHCTADDATLRQRIRQRQQHGKDASEADLQVLAYQYESADPLTDNELSCSRRVDTTDERSLARLLDDLTQILTTDE